MKHKLNLFISTIFAICATSSVQGQIISTYAGTGTAGYSGDLGPATAGQIKFATEVATDGSGNLYIADYENHRIRRVDALTGVITTIAGTGAGEYYPTDNGNPATAARIKWPMGMAFDASGNLFFCDYGNNLIRKINTSGIISNVAGVAVTLPSFSGDGGPATAANMGNPTGVDVDAAGNIYIADQQNHRIRVVNTSGIINTICGNGLIGVGAAGDGGIATAAKLNEPTDVALDGAGNIYIADNGNNRVRKINATTGIISTVVGVVAGAGPGSVYGYAGDGGPATAARVYYPKAIDVDNPGNIYISDWNNNVIRKVNTSGLIFTIAGTGSAGFSGDGGLADAAKLNKPTGVAVSTTGDVFISDNENNRIRRIKIGNDPYFTLGASKNVVICPTEFTILDTALRVDDIDVGQTLTWSTVLAPMHGTLVATYSTLSTGSTVTPVSITYAPSVGYIGLDTFKVGVNDGTYWDTITLYADVVAPLLAGVISGVDTICPGNTVVLSSTVPGGVWSSQDTDTATVATGGVVTGVAPGVTTISYTVNSHCGTAIAVKTVTVLATVPCVSNVTNLAQEQGEMVTMMPNPNNGSFAITIASVHNEQAIVGVFDITGRQVARQIIQTNKPTAMNIGMPTGVYMVQVLLSGKKITQKLIIE